MEEEKITMEPNDDEYFGDDEITSNDKLWALLGYIFGIVALIALLLEDKKDRPFIRYHAIQALMLWVITFILTWTMCLWVLPWAYGVYIGILAYQGQWMEVPGLTNFAKNQGWINK